MTYGYLLAPPIFCGGLLLWCMIDAKLSRGYEPLESKGYTLRKLPSVSTQDRLFDKYERLRKASARDTLVGYPKTLFENWKRCEGNDPFQCQRAFTFQRNDYFRLLDCYNNAKKKTPCDLAHPPPFCRIRKILTER